MSGPSIWRGAPRFLVATVALVLLYIALQLAAVNVLDFAVKHGWSPDRRADTAERNARQSDAASEAAEANFTPRHRLAAWKLGRAFGFASEALCCATVIDAQAWADKQAAAARLLGEEQFAEFLQVGPAAALESKTLRDYGNLAERIERDESGLGARIEARTTPRHRHLFLAGAHVGMYLYKLAAAPGMDLSPSAREIELHASLARLPRAVWEPLARPPSSRSPQERTETYFAAVQAADAAVLAGGNGSTR